MNLNDPKLSKINDILTSNGYSCWIVGGAVRDFLSQKSPRDYDFCTNATPDKVAELFADYKVIPMGIAHGTVTIHIEYEPFEITTTHYLTNGKIEYVNDIETDLSHRDFTINAMAMDFDGNTIDPFGGKADLQNNVVRFVGNPQDRINEDPLRMVRFFRFSSTELNEQSFNAIIDNSYKIETVSGWRLWNELSKSIILPNANWIMEQLGNTGILSALGISNYHKDIIFKNGDPYSAFVHLLYLLNEDADILANFAKKFEWSSLQKAKSRIILERLYGNKSLSYLKTRISAHNEPKKWIIDALMLDNQHELAKKIEKWNIPQFPLAETEIDQELYPILKCEWAESGFRLNREQLLKKIAIYSL